MEARGSGICSGIKKVSLCDCCWQHPCLHQKSRQQFWNVLNTHLRFLSLTPFATNYLSSVTLFFLENQTLNAIYASWTGPSIRWKLFIAFCLGCALLRRQKAEYQEERRGQEATQLYKYGLYCSWPYSFLDVFWLLLVVFQSTFWKTLGRMLRVCALAAFTNPLTSEGNLLQNALTQPQEIELSIWFAKRYGISPSLSMIENKKCH